MICLITGGAGFIGSNLAHALVARGDEVRVLDNLSSGFAKNVPDGATFLRGDICDPEVLKLAMSGCDVVFHQAALRAVLRSVLDPLATDRVNTGGTLSVLKAAVDLGVPRVVSASSSSVYGGAAQLPTPETAPLAPRSPYAVSKVAGEHYARVFAELYGLETVSLRYFNVYGPRQRPDSAYAAVIPLFIASIRDRRSPEVHGDGLQSRSFTFIEDVVAANLAAASASPPACVGQAYNIAGKEATSLLDLLAALRSQLGQFPPPVHVPNRPGDVRHTWADVSQAEQALGFRASIGLSEGLERTAAWFTETSK